MTTAQLKELDKTLESKSKYLCDLAIRLFNDKKQKDAAQLWAICVDLTPHKPEIYHNLGSLFTQSAQHEQARQLYGEALERILRPKVGLGFKTDALARAYAAYAESCRKCCDVDASIVNAQKAVETYGEDQSVLVAALTTLAAAEHDLGDNAKSEHLSRMILSHDASNKQANLNLVLLDMEAGHLAKNWTDYSKWLGFSQNPKTEGMEQKEEWDGTELREDETLLVISDQGSGDLIQFGSLLFAKMLPHDRDVILYAQKELVSLMKTNFNFSEVYAFGQAPKNLKFDKFITLLGLMRLAKVESTDDLDVSERLVTSKEKFNEWREKIQSNKLKVGLSWSGEVFHGNDHQRSMHFAQLSPLRHVEGTDFYSLQVGQKAAQLEGFSWVVDLGKDFKDFSDTAGAIANLDVVVSVDTAVAHLAGCLGKKLLLALPKVPEWRHQIKGGKTPWYPDADCFVQESRCDWSSVIQGIMTKLRRMIA